MPKKLASRPRPSPPSGPCVRCGRRRPLPCRGLCRPCHWQTLLDAQAGCRHCVTGKVSRPRGLCWHCYYTPGVKDQYPSTSPFATYASGARDPATAETPEDLDGDTLDRRAAELPVQPIGNEDAPPPRPYRGPLTPYSRRKCEASDHWRGWGRAAGATHPDTAPQRIAADQAEVVRQAVMEFGNDPAAISAAVVLPISVVERRLSEIAAGES